VRTPPEPAPITNKSKSNSATSFLRDVVKQGQTTFAQSLIKNHLVNDHYLGELVPRVRLKTVDLFSIAARIPENLILLVAIVMKIISFNVNGLRARPHQMAELIKRHSPDVIGIQEIKVHDDEFPVAMIEDLGYHVDYHGQKGHYGVCLISKKPAISIQKGFKTDLEDAQRRMIIGQYESDKGNIVTVLNGYFPQGENIDHATKFPAKKKFYQDLQIHLNENCDSNEHVIVMGDLNISPQEMDIGIGEPNRKRWLKTGKASFQPIEREWLATLLGWGLKDTYRLHHPVQDNRYSWFDYRSKGFADEPKRGLRIDAVLATDSLYQACVGAEIDYEIRAMEKPSDHAPIWAEFDI
jgi:exodeoxyribonuclease-3